jgi:glucose-6-phosphate isomerase, archaeal
MPLTFGAWCDREFGFEYDGIRAHRGLAWFPVWEDSGVISWKQNSNYTKSKLVCKRPEPYVKLGIIREVPIYSAFENDPDVFLYVSDPGLKEKEWEDFVP